MKKRNYGIILVLILLIGVGYAYLSTTLTINGIANFKKNDWNIIWDEESIDVLRESVTMTAAEQTEEGGGYFAPRCATTAQGKDCTTVEYKAPLRLPGDIYHFQVDMWNKGSIDAMITENGVRKLIDPQFSDAEKAYIIYEVKYADGNDIKVGDGLKAGAKRKVDVYIKYRDDVTASQLPDEDNVRTLRSEFEFVQADNTANYIRMSATSANAVVTKTSATENAKPIVEGTDLIADATLTAQDANYTVTVTYTNKGDNAVKFKGVTSTGINSDVELSVQDSTGAALAVDTTVAKDATLVVKYVFTVKNTVTYSDPIDINAENAVASIVTNFAE